MRRKSSSIVGACALGALIGILVALDISARFQYGPYRWGVIGALLGGIVACVAVDFRHICARVARSYRKTIARTPDREWWRAWGFLACGIATLYTSICCIAGAWTAYFSNDTPAVGMQALGVVFAAWALAAGVGALQTLVIVSTAKNSEDRAKRINNSVVIGWTTMKWTNPIGILIGAYVGVAWVIPRVPLVIAKARSREPSSA
jgi:hypothetical protein